jgi:MFS family permease
VAFCVAVGFGMFLPVITVFAKQFGVSDFAASFIVSIFAAARLVSTGPAAWMTNRFGEAKVLATGLGIVAVTSVMVGFSRSYPEFLIWRTAGGLGSAMFTVSALALLLRVTPSHLRGRASGLYQGGFVVGNIAGPGIGSLFAFSLRAPFFVNAGMLVIASGVTMLMLLHARFAVDAEPTDAAAKTELNPLEDLRGARGLAHGLRMPVYRLVVITSLVQGFVLFGMRNALVPLFAAHQLGSTRLSSYAFGLGALTNATLLFTAGRTSDLRGRKPAFLIGSSMMFTGTALMALPAHTATFLLSAMCFGIGGSFIGASMPAMLGDVTRGARGGVLVAAYQGVGDLGAILGPLAGGLILERTDSYMWTFAFAAAIVSMVVLLGLRTPESRAAHHAQHSPVVSTSQPD